MAVKRDPDLGIPESTGAVTTDTSPVTVTQPSDNTSTGALKGTGDPVVVKVTLSSDPVVVVQTPGPETIESPFAPQAKVVTPALQDRAARQATPTAPVADLK